MIWWLIVAEGWTGMASIQRGFLFRKKRPNGINGFWTAHPFLINFTFLPYHILSIIPSIPKTVCDVIMMSSAQLLAAALGQMYCPSDATTASLLRQWQIMQISSQSGTDGGWVTSHMLQKGNTWTTNHCSDNSAFTSGWSVRGAILSLEFLRENSSKQQK